MLYKNANVFLCEKGFVHGGFWVEGDRFTQILEGDTNEPGTDLKGAYVIPGLVDVHTHGCAGHDFSDGNLNGLQEMGQYYAAHGITTFAPTSMTLPYDTLAAAFQTAVEYRAHPLPDGARIGGIHMEGPYFSEKRKGAQNAAYLKEPDFEGFRTLYEGCGGLVRIVDVAAELPGAVEFTRRAAELCAVSVAHTDTGYDGAAAVFDAGATHLTHLYNAMPPLLHRAPGPIGAASERESVTAELICDGLHVHPGAVRAAFKLFPGRLCLISDSLRCCGMPDGTYELGGQQVFLKGGVARLEDGTIAGAATDLYDGMRNAVQFGISRETAILSATTLPARELGNREIGAIEGGRYADFVVCDEGLNRKAVYLGGTCIISEAEDK